MIWHFIVGKADRRLSASPPLPAVGNNQIQQMTRVGIAGSNVAVSSGSGRLPKKIRTLRLLVRRGKLRQRRSTAERLYLENSSFMRTRIVQRDRHRNLKE